MQKNLTLEHQEQSEITTYRPKFVALNVKDTIKVIAVEDIVYLESRGRFTTLHFNNKNNVTVSKNLGHFEGLFKNNHFLRIHHSFLINVAYLINIIKDGGGQYCEMNYVSQTLPISNRRFSFVKKYLYY